jgi:hypothetical protein
MLRRVAALPAVRTSLEILVAAGLDVEHAPPHRAVALLFESIILTAVTF